ncbi:hypothetical protein AVEN_187448-1 [Araneus ventricosus]|uniref:Uncharacterized protein n=1 Tax=Araneus ventricosus TaxID=182803 RepID=A0A4Y2BTA6_ARAVE|nr:hypothetical protein AVEN_187448-1 [Araneus ventricosus]
MTSPFGKFHNHIRIFKYNSVNLQSVIDLCCDRILNDWFVRLTLDLEGKRYRGWIFITLNCGHMRMATPEEEPHFPSLVYLTNMSMMDPYDRFNPLRTTVTRVYRLLVVLKARPSSKDQLPPDSS